MSQKELILVHPTEVINKLFQIEGFAQNAAVESTFGDIGALEKDLDEGLAIMRREAVEKNADFRHLLPYIQLFRISDDNELELFVYQRVKGIGEERLLGRHSVGLGGHINVGHVQFHDGISQLNLGMTIIHNVMEELCEELKLGEKNFIEGLLEQNIRSQPSIYGYLNDNSDEVGQRHLGITLLMMIPKGIEPEIAEESAVKVGWVKLSDLRANIDNYNFENWSKLVVTELEDSFVTALTDAGIAADLQYEAFKAQQAEAVVDLVAMGGIEGFQATGEAEAQVQA